MQRKLLGLMAVLAASACLHAVAQTSVPLSEDDPAVWEARAARAKKLREESSKARHAADSERAQEDLACRKKFLENACKDSARERWIEKINKVRALEIEAVGLERNQRAHELAMREKARAANPSRPSLLLPGQSAAKASSSSPHMPTQPAAKPLDAAKQAARQAERQQERAEKAQEAAERASQARKDAARYAARAKEKQQKDAERARKTQGSSASASSK